MKSEHTIYGLLIVLTLGLIGCSNSKGGNYDPYLPDSENGAPRMVVKGKVTNTADEPLQGIYVAIYGVREPSEPDVLSYNYALTNTTGDYTIVRYRGRELPTEVTVVATDSTGVYEEQVLFAPVTYDTISTRTGKEPYNAFVTADFILVLKE